jgi:hypothetical protein
MNDILLKYQTFLNNTKITSSRYSDILEKEVQDIIYLVFVDLSKEGILDIVSRNNVLLDELTDNILGDTVDIVYSHHLYENDETIYDMYTRFKKRRYSDYIRVIQRSSDTQELIENLHIMNRTHKNWITGLSDTMQSVSYHSLQEPDYSYDKEEYVSVLDERTSGFCKDMNGRVFERGKGPMPPCHIRCRSIRIPKGD